MRRAMILIPLLFIVTGCKIDNGSSPGEENEAYACIAALPTADMQLKFTSFATLPPSWKIEVLNWAEADSCQTAAPPPGKALISVRGGNSESGSIAQVQSSNDIKFIHIRVIDKGRCDDPADDRVVLESFDVPVDWITHADTRCGVMKWEAMVEI